MTITASPEAPTATERLTAHDRCDRCGAQAYTRFESTSVEGLELLMCAHHTREHKDALVAKGFVMTHDDTDLLTNENRLQGDDHA